ncbi:hypothetical protein Poli38472_008032 [Pythium oligandrum]|uniref:Apple domain-containing protein n=1 Tax=Pythium oligandrum TaxID=41045 RepID=A0A8K1CML8_PYTOL|nr:hypothetical protein Poli38472_008032 [Pythium oligandrum]|eukprot:TMW65390.1 hypothetical protein Poli38472_008032 [Pythium oligandrum]
MRIPRVGALIGALAVILPAIDAQAYDVVIVGSGPGGLVAAEYLSRDANVSVLILEAGLPSLQATGGTDGPSYASSKGWTQFDIPGEFDNTIYNSANEKYRVDFVTGPYMWLGKLVGGCSSINAALYFRPPDSYVTNTKWPFSPSRVAALLDENEKIHDATDAPSADGKYYLQEAYNIVANAFKKIGYNEKTINDPAARNAKSQTFGHAPYTIKNGLRDTPAKAFWNLMKTRSNVKLVTSAMVSYIRQYQGKATAVVYNTNVEVPLTARGAVIMAAGALGTPKVLIQSGVGPQDQINLLNLRGDFPGVKNGGWVINNNVGKNLFDTNVVFASFSHPDQKSFQYKTKPSWAIDQYMNQGQTGGWASPGPVLIGYENYQVNGRAYEFQTTVLTAGFDTFYSQGNAFTTSLYVNNPEARDYSSFSADGKWNAFTQNSMYLATGNDLAAMQNYATRVVDALRANGATFLSAANGQSVADWVKGYGGRITHHFGGSCYASSDTSDSKRCADEKLRVIGTSNIFVGDATAMRDGTVNPYGFIMYVGREVGDQVKSYVASGPTPPPSTCTIENGVDYVGNDIGSVLSATAEGCCSICSGRSGCGAFSWTSYGGGTCWLKSSKGTTKADSSVRSSVISSTPTPPPPSCSIEENIDYIGNDLASALSSTAEGCCSICKAYNGCGAFSWSTFNSGTCWLKSSKGATQTSTGVRSSVVGSTTPPPTPPPTTPTPPPTTPPPPPSSQCSAVEENVDYTGNDIGSAASSSVDGCCSLCAQRSGCGAYTWTNQSGGTCWLKSGKGGTTSKSGARSATYSPDGKTCSLTNDVDYYGNDIGSALSSSASGCCSICRSRSGCAAFTWTSQDGGTCWLKSTAGSAVAKAGAVAGKI